MRFSRFSGLSLLVLLACCGDPVVDMDFEEALRVLHPHSAERQSRLRAALRAVEARVPTDPRAVDALVGAMGHDPGVVPWEPAVEAIIRQREHTVARLEQGVTSNDGWESRFCITVLGRLGAFAARSIPVLERRRAEIGLTSRIEPVGIRRLIDDTIARIRSGR